VLERCGALELSDEVRGLLLRISAATIDRLLQQEKRKLRVPLRKRGRTKPGSLLKHQIPIRTFADWDDAVPGFVEVDLVEHNGGEVRGEYIQTLDVVDVSTSWTETRAVPNKARRWVIEALEDVMEHLPFRRFARILCP